MLGSEGAFGVITSVTVRVRPLPAEKVYEGWRWPSFAAGAAAMRTLAQAGLLPTVLRLSDETETARSTWPSPTRSAAAGRGRLPDDRRLRGRRPPVAAGGGGRGGAHGARRHRPRARTAARRGPPGRFHAPYLRDSMLDVGVLVETLETATFWSSVAGLYAAVKTR